MSIADGVNGSIVPKATLVHGSIAPKAILVGTVAFPTNGPLVEDYTGSYDIVPSVDAQIMETSGKRMTADVQIQAIPYYEVSNTDGCTVIIGG